MNKSASLPPKEVEYCPVCNVQCGTVPVLGIKCCPPCETFYYRISKRKKRPPKCEKKCWTKWPKLKERPEKKSQCMYCRFIRMRALGVKKKCKFEINERQGASSAAVVALNSQQKLNCQSGKDCLSTQTLQLDIIDRMLRLNLGKCFDFKNEPPRIVQLVMGSGQILNYMNISSAQKSKFMLSNDLEKVIKYAQNPTIFGKKLIFAVENFEEMFFETYEYQRSCECMSNQQELLGNAHGADEWSASSDEHIFHWLFNFFLVIGWIDKITARVAEEERVPICAKGRGTTARAFEYLIKSNLLNPFGPQLDLIKQEIKRQFAIDVTLTDPDQCIYDCGTVPIGAAHPVSNLLLQLGLASGDELRQHASYKCLSPDGEPGLPVRAYDVMKCCLESGRFHVYGKNKIFPVNHSTNDKAIDCTNSERFKILDLTDDETEFPDDELCFVFITRRNPAQTTRNGIFFGTKSRVYVGLSTFSETKFDHWYFVPKRWREFRLRNRKH